MFIYNFFYIKPNCSFPSYERVFLIFTNFSSGSLLEIKHPLLHFLVLLFSKVLGRRADHPIRASQCWWLNVPSVLLSSVQIVLWGQSAGTPLISSSAWIDEAGWHWDKVRVAPPGGACRTRHASPATSFLQYPPTWERPWVQVALTTTTPLVSSLTPTPPPQSPPTPYPLPTAVFVTLVISFLSNYSQVLWRLQINWLKSAAQNCTLTTSVGWSMDLKAGRQEEEIHMHQHEVNSKQGAGERHTPSVWVAEMWTLCPVGSEKIPRSLSPNEIRGVSWGV